MATKEEIEKKWKLAQNTSLWKRTLGSTDEFVTPLRKSFLDARENAIFLLEKIRKDFPNLTVHDITHVDSLWNVADTIIGKDYPINPLEGYILGIAFLIHDAALSYDASGGKDKLRNTIEWKDAFADNPGDKDDEEFKKECDFVTIRALHARYAEDILNKKFEKDNTTTFYIIDNDEYRTQFEDMIGKIAASHHWSIDDVSKLDTQINPGAELPGDWEINEQKLACILRCADAGHIDNGRAPYCIYNSMIVNGVSRDHWESQTRLGQVKENQKNKEQLLITSTRPFDKDNFAAWNVAYDAVRLFDEELKKSNELLKPLGLSFPHIGVAGAESKEALSNYIKTKDWQPCSIGVHTSNIKSLIENLGGSKLYGEDNLLLVALRELIQNARDAIQARRTMDGHPEDGRITIRLIEDGGKRWIVVEDDGIGMSLDCIKHNLLDFGNSYWKSSLAKYENKGLWSNGFTSIGKFGIGFYSIFMVAKSVEVVTKRYDMGVKDANKIEFPIGLTLSPILSKTTLKSSLSTIVKFELKDEIDLNFKINRAITSLQKAVQILVAGLDTDVYYEENYYAQKVHTNIKSNSFDKKKWLEDLFIKCPDNIEILASKLEELTDENGESRGLILPPEEFMHLSSFGVPCIKTISGLLSSFSSDQYFIDKSYIGYIDGKEKNISRNDFFLDNPLKICLQKWVKKKYKNNYNDIVSNKDLSYKYYKLIEICDLKEEILKDNTIRIYATMRNNIQNGTIKELCNIHIHMFSGIDYSIKMINLHGGNLYAEEIFIEKITSGKNECATFDKFYKSDFINIKNKENFKDLKTISKMPTSNYEEIVQKYCKIFLFELFTDENHKALKVWTNFMLDMAIGLMIDWRNVDDIALKKLIRIDDIINKGMFNNTCTYFKRFLIPSDNYLKEIGALSYENS